ncbi:MAG: hypothetical protein FIA94_07080 [Nitrospirae bacterium]|nr:hypothetical protein [Nitrospirota bacterium]
MNFLLLYVSSLACDAGKSAGKLTDDCTNDRSGRCLMLGWFRRKRQEYKMRRQLRNRYWKLIRLEVANKETISA